MARSNSRSKHEQDVQQLHNLASKLLKKTKKGKKKRQRSQSENGRGRNSRSGSKSRAGSRARSGSRGRNKNGQQQKPKPNGFAMVQMPTPQLTERMHVKLNEVYADYHTGHKPVWPDKLGTLTAFQSSREDGGNPMTIVARKLRETKKTKQYVNPTGGANRQGEVKHLAYTTTSYDEVEQTFLLYSAVPTTPPLTTQLTTKPDTNMKSNDFDKEIFDADIEKAKLAWKEGVHYIFYSMALTSKSNTTKKSKNCVFISILVPCTVISDITETTIIEENQLGTVQVKSFEGDINSLVLTRKQLLTKYGRFLFGMNYDEDCDLTTDQLQTIDFRFKNIIG